MSLLATAPSIFGAADSDQIRSGAALYLVRDARLAPTHAQPLDLYIGVNTGVAEYYLVGEPVALQGALITLGVADRFSIRPIDHAPEERPTPTVGDPLRVLAPVGYDEAVDVYSAPVEPEEAL